MKQWPIIIVVLYALIFIILTIPAGPAKAVTFFRLSPHGLRRLSANLCDWDLRHKDWRTSALQAERRNPIMHTA